MIKGRQKEEGRMKNEDRVVPANGEKLRASDGRDVALRRPRPRSSGRNGNAHCAIHALRCAAERGADGAGAPSLPALKVVSAYALDKSILEKIWLERLRQKQLLREGKIFFACDSPVVSHDRKLRVLTEELGEVAGAIDQIEILNPLRQPRAEMSEPSARAKNNLRDELAQIAAVAIAWLESLQKETL